MAGEENGMNLKVPSNANHSRILWLRSPQPSPQYLTEFLKFWKAWLSFISQDLDFPRHLDGTAKVEDTDLTFQVESSSKTSPISLTSHLFWQDLHTGPAASWGYLNTGKREDVDTPLKGVFCFGKRLRFTWYNNYGCATLILSRLKYIWWPMQTENTLHFLLVPRFFYWNF